MDPKLAADMNLLKERLEALKAAKQAASQKEQANVQSQGATSEAPVAAPPQEPAPAVESEAVVTDEAPAASASEIPVAPADSVVVSGFGHSVKIMYLGGDSSQFFKYLAECSCNWQSHQHSYVNALQMANHHVATRVARAAFH